MTPFACILLGLIIWACVPHSKSNTTEYMSFEPMPSDGSTLITYTTYDSNSFNQYTERLEKVFEPYVTPFKIEKSSPYYINCEQGEPPKPGTDRVCFFDIRYLGCCTPERNYGFDKHGTPCIFLKFNGFTDWLPQYYKSSSVLPDTMPDHLKKTISEIEANHGGDSKKLNTVWVSCEGEKVADKESIGPLEYYQNGFDGAYFPAINKETYMSPLVAIHFLRPRYSAVISVQCKAWAKNLDHEKGEGVVNFQLELLP